MVETRRRVLGQEHPSMLTSMANLVSTYQNQEQWKEAEKLEVQVMEISKRVLGQDHQLTLAITHDLGYTWKSQNREQEAIDLMSQAQKL